MDTGTGTRCQNAWCDCCSCKKNCDGFQKIMELKGGLVIYRHTESGRLDDSDRKEISKSKGPKLIDEAFSESKQHTDAQTDQEDDHSTIIIHNTRDINVYSADYLSDIDINEVGCPRCRYIMARAKRLLASVPVLDKNDVRSVCDVCKSYAPCHMCQRVIKKFETTRKKEDRKSRILSLLRKTNTLLESKRQGRAYTDVDIKKYFSQRKLYLDTFDHLKQEPKICPLVRPKSSSALDTMALPLSDVIKKVTIRDETVYEIPKNLFSVQDLHRSTELDTLNKHEDEQDNVKSVVKITKEENISAENEITVNFPIKPILKSTFEKEEILQKIQSDDRMKKTPHHYGDASKTWKKDTAVLGIGNTGIIRRSHSEESLPTSFTGIREHLFKKQFKYLFLHSVKKEATQLVKTSAELVKETQDRLKSKAEDKIKLQQKEDQEKKHVAAGIAKTKAKSGILIPDDSFVSVLAGKREYNDKNGEDLAKKGKGEIKMEEWMGKEKSIHKGKNKEESIRIEERNIEKEQRETVGKGKGEKMLNEKEEKVRTSKSEKLFKKTGEEVTTIKGESLLKKTEERVRTVKGEKLFKEKEERVRSVKGEKVLKNMEESGKIITGEKLGKEDRDRTVKGEKLLKETREGVKAIKSEKLMKETGERVRAFKGEKLLKEKEERVKTVKGEKLLKEMEDSVKTVKGDKLLKEIGERVDLVKGEKLMKEKGERKGTKEETDVRQKTKELQGSEVQEQKSQASDIIAFTKPTEVILDQTTEKSAGDATHHKDEVSQTDMIIRLAKKNRQEKKAEKQASEKQKVSKTTKSTVDDEDDTQKAAPTKSEIILLNKVITKHEKLVVEGKKQRAVRDTELTKTKQMAEKRTQKQDTASAEYLDVRDKKMQSIKKDIEHQEISPKKSGLKQEVNIKDIKMLTDDGGDLILKMIKAKNEEAPKHAPPAPAPPPAIAIIKPIRKEASEIKVDSKATSVSAASLLKTFIDVPEIIVGTEIKQMKHSPPNQVPNPKSQPALFKTIFKEDAQEFATEIKPEPKTIENKGTRQGTFRYTLSDRTFIENGWTMLPTEKIVRKMNIYRLRPVKREFDWFEHNKKKGIMHYNSGEKLAEIDENGYGRWYYKNGRLALNYYDCEEANVQQRYVVYSSGSPDERGRSRPVTVLAMFDYLGNGVVFDHQGKIRLKYNQTEGVVLDRSVGADSLWKWHSLNDPPELQQVMIDTQLSYKDPEILELEPSNTDDPRPDDDQMIAIEYENYIKNKPSQKFEPFQIRMKAMKINEQFSLKILNQKTIYLTFREGSTNIKLNLGMVIDSDEIVDTGTADFGVVELSLEKLPAPTDSLADLQKSLENASRSAQVRTQREQSIRPVLPDASADKLTAAASKPMRPPLMPSHRKSTSSCTNLYYNTRLI